MDLFPWFLFAHVLGAIIAFGPTFSFPIIGRMGGMEREHGNFATRVSSMLSRIQVVPFALLQGVTGLGLILTRNIDVMKAPWLMVSIVLYLVALGYAIFVQTPTVKRVLAMTTPGAGGPPAGAPPAGGPPAELMGLIRKIQRGGMILAALIITIVFLMVVKPTF